MADILSIGVSGLLSFQRSLNTTGHNIANSDTVGYSRQRTLLATQTPQQSGAGWIGSGVKVVDIERIYDDFLATQVRTSQSTTSNLETFADHASRIDNILADPAIGLDPAMQDFFDAMQGLADDPSSIASRQLLLAESQSMVDRFHDISGQFDDMQSQLNNEMQSVATEISSRAESLARVNQNIIDAIGSSGGQSPNDLLDQRENLLNELSERVDISVVSQENGAVNVFIGKGQALVMDTVASSLTTVIGQDDASQLDLAFTGVSGVQVVTDQLSGGEIGGLISYRDQILNPAQNQLGLIAVSISDRINSQHRLGLDLNGNSGTDMFIMPDISATANSSNASAATVAAALVDSGNLTASDYKLEADTVADQFILTRLSDGEQTSINTGGAYPHTTAEIDGFSLTISAAATAGDEFNIRPTRNMAQLISMEINDPRSFAAAGPLRSQPTTNAVSGAPNRGSGVISQPSITNTSNLPLTGPSAITLQWTGDLDSNGTADDPGFLVAGGPGGILAYDPATERTGKTFTLTGFGDAEITISGVPEEGDRFIIENNTAAQGDNRNALLLSSLQTSNTMLGGTGGAGETATFQEAYGQLVSDVGSRTRQAEVNFESTEGLLERHKTALSAVNGVNLDEEAANLIKFQQAYQAAAQVISVANTLFDTLLGAVRG